MFSDRVSDYFEGVAAKYLSAVDINPKRSHQHELGGLPSVGFTQWLGVPGKEEEFRFDARFVYLDDATDVPESCDCKVTWYDCRRKVVHRAPEFRLYYEDNPVARQAAPGDFFLIAKMKSGKLLLVFTPAGGSAESQLRLLFGLSQVDLRFHAGAMDDVDLLLPLRFMLEDLGIEAGAPAHDDLQWLDRLVEAFGGHEFPATSAFSVFARDTLPSGVDPLRFPDETLLAWMDHEEKLFRLYERHLVQEKLQAGFGASGNDVDDFISFSLSVQNRRKSRVGHAFEGHLHLLFELHELQFEQGRGKGKVTENNAKPDFLFPGFDCYHDPSFPTGKLCMLGAKTTCKDRWRQVLSEADRIPRKFLVTLEAAISEAQTHEMQSHGLQLVIPRAIHATYSEQQQGWLFSLASFIEHVRDLER